MPNVLDPYFLTEVVRNIRTDPNQFMGAQLLTGGAELKPELGLTIEYDVTYDETGMTPPTSLNDPSPIRKSTTVDHQFFTNQEWREKKVIDRQKLATLRAPGSDLERMWGEDYMIQQMIDLNTRLETRLEWMRWQVLTGSLTIPATSGKPAVTLNYNVPGANKPTAATLWSNTATSDPISDIDTWLLNFRGTGAVPFGIIANKKVDNLLKKNSAVRDLLRTSYGRDLVQADTLSFVLDQALNGLKYKVYEGGYLDDSGVFTPFIPDNAIIIVGKGMTGNMMDLVTSPNNYEDLFKGQIGKFAMAKEIAGDPPTWNVINGVIALPRLLHSNWHVIATVA